MFPFRLPENTASETPAPAAPVIAEASVPPAATETPRILEPVEA